MATARMTIAVDEPIATVRPELHGQFAEHLGRLVYPGIWVGEDSPVPNEGGIRTDVIEALRPLAIPVVRWPGGCFADDYHWRDGIGPRDRRPGRITGWGKQHESNHFGTHEFIRFARAIGAEPYLGANVGSGTVQEMREWIEYCNQPTGTAIADERSANGDPETFGVRWWGIGNESWGCGGRMSPEYYAEEYSRFHTFGFGFGETDILPVACGPGGATWDWTTRFFEQTVRHNRLQHVHNFAAHYYAGTTGHATEYTETQWLEMLAKAAGVDGIITGHRALMDRWDPERRIGLILDEWGTWHPVDQGMPENTLYQQNTIRDALVAAITLDVFNQRADILAMANIAQLINVLQALLLVDETRCVKTPTYHVFSLYAPHRGGTSLRVTADSRLLSNGEDSAQALRRTSIDRHLVELREVTGSATRHDGSLCITLVNSNPVEPSDTTVTLRSGRAVGATAVTLATPDIHDHNTFDDPDRVTPGDRYDVATNDHGMQLHLPPASVTQVLADLDA